MPKRSSTKRDDGSGEDPNVTAYRVVQTATDETEASSSGSEKNQAAVALGRLGGKKGGPARAKKLSAKRRSEIARKAARARWEKRK